MFFAISGFIMVHVTGAGSFSAPQFLWRRIVRIVPLYWLFTALAASLAVVAPALFKTTNFTWPHFIQSLLFIAHEAPNRGGTSPLLSLGWTLNYEAFFYVVFAALAAFAARTRIALISTLFIALWLLGLLLPITDPVAQFYLNLSPLAFAAGCGIAGLFQSRKLLASSAAPAVIGAGSVAGLVAIVLSANLADPTLRFFGEIALACGVLAWMLRRDGGQNWSRLLGLLGNATYAIYLSHMFVIAGIVGVVSRLLAVENPVLLTVLSLCCAVLAVIVGVVVHQQIEKPLLSMVARRRPPRLVLRDA